MVVYGVGDSIEEATSDHDKNLANFLMKCREKGVKLNKKNLELCCTEIPFMGHLITSERLKADPGKIEAVIKMPKPQDVKDVRKLCGFVNYLAKFMPRLSAVIEPLRQLTHKEAEWKWMHEHDAAFEKIKSMVTTTPVLKYYNPEEELTSVMPAKKDWQQRSYRKDNQSLLQVVLLQIPKQDMRKSKRKCYQ